MTAPTETKPATGGNAKGKAPMPRRPFVAGTRRVDRATYDETKTLTAGTQDLRTYECDPNGFLGGAYILVEAVTAGNSAAVAFAEDGPFSVIDTLTFNDTNNKPVLGPMTGWDLKEVVKFGGYAFSDDCRESPVYAATTGAGATGGSFTFVLRLPVELVHRDGLGSLPNKSSSSTFDITVRLAAGGVGALYTTAPTAQPSVRVRIQQFGWMDPNAGDSKGNPVAQNPPGVQTTQYWSKQTYIVNAGAMTNLRITGIDSFVRNLIFVLEDSTGARSVGDADFPDPFTMLYETSNPIQRLRTVWRHMIAEKYGYKAAVETAGGRDYGVYPECYNDDFGLKPGAETRLGYLPVSSATTIALTGTIGGSGVHTLSVYVNKVVPAGGNPLVLTGR